MTPANIEPAWPDAVKMAVRFAISLGLLEELVSLDGPWKDGEPALTYYQDPITYSVPQYVLASIKPMKNRTTQS
jgi:hypothetical protein